MMKPKTTLMLLILFSLISLNTFAQDYTQRHLPEGAKARLGKGWISEIKYSPDGRQLAMAGSIGIWLYDAHTGMIERLLTGHTDWVNSVSYSPDGKILASGSLNDNNRLWDTNTGTHLRTLTGTYSTGVVSFSPDGNTIVSAHRNSSIKLSDANTGEIIKTFKGEPRVDRWGSILSISPNGNMIAIGMDDGTIHLWDTNTGEIIKTWRGAGDSNSYLAFSPDGNTIASGYSLWVGGIVLRDTKTGERIKELSKDGIMSVTSLSFLNENMIASGSADGAIHLWDVSTGRITRTLTGHTGRVYNISFSPDGSTIASASFDDTIRLWNTNTGEIIKTIKGHTDWVSSVAFSSDGSTIASGYSYGHIRLWNAHTRELIKIFRGHTDWVNSVSFSPDGQNVVSGSWDETIRLWNVNTGKLIKTFRGHTDWVNSVSFSPDGNTIASASEDGTIRLWDAKTGTHLRTLRGHTDWVNSVSFSPDGNTIASASEDETIRLWDTNTGTRHHTLRGYSRSGVDSVSFSPDGNTIASSDWVSIRLSDPATGEHLRTLTDTDTWGYTSVSFSPDGNTIASGYFNDIRLWDANTGTYLRTLTGHLSEDTGISLSFSPDGNTIVSGNWDGTILLWELVPSSTSTTTVSLLPSPIVSPALGEQLSLSLNIVGGQQVAGYQATITYNHTALRYVESVNGDYLPQGAFFIPPVAKDNTVQLAAASLAGKKAGDGTLATITFEVIAVEDSIVRLADVLLTDSTGQHSTPKINNAQINAPSRLPEDVNGDGIVNIIDLTLVASNFGKQGENVADVNDDGIVNIIDLTLVASAFGNVVAAPEIWNHHLEGTPTRAEVEQWLRQAQQMNLNEPDFQRGIHILEQLLEALIPKETALLPNYPNPFNPETWIPYQLATSADVTISIYAVDGTHIRTLDVGHQPIGIYQARSRAAYWDGKNAVGESMASGVYFYTLTAGDFSATRKMLITK